MWLRGVGWFGSEAAGLSLRDAVLCCGAGALETDREEEEEEMEEEEEEMSCTERTPPLPHALSPWSQGPLA